MNEPIRFGHLVVTTMFAAVMVVAIAFYRAVQERWGSWK
jgi:hypothetical protein